MIDCVETHGAKGADRDTGATANADIVIHRYGIKLGIAINGFNGACMHARGILTLLARHRYVKTLCFPLDDFNTTAHRVGNAIMFYGTNQFAQTATGTFFIFNF